MKSSTYILSLHSVLSNAIFSSIPSRFISYSITFLQVFLGIPLPLAILSLCHPSSLLTGASLDLLLTCSNHLKRFSIILNAIGATPTFFLIISFLKRSFLVCLHIQRNMRISATFILST